MSMAEALRGRKARGPEKWFLSNKSDLSVSMVDRHSGGAPDKALSDKSINWRVVSNQLLLLFCCSGEGQNHSLGITPERLFEAKNKDFRNRKEDHAVGSEPVN